MYKLNRGSTFKRLGAAMMDFFLALILGMFLINIVGSNIANAAFNINEKSEEYRDYLFDAGLLVYAKQDSKTNKYDVVLDFSSTDKEKEEVEKDKESKYSYLSLNSTSLNITSERYDKCLTHFYTEVDKLADYQKMKDDSDVFKNESSDETKLREFYDKAYTSAATEKYLKLYKDGKALELYQSITAIQNGVTIISYIVSFGVFYLLVPLISKKRATLGKMMMSLAVVNKNTGFVASRVAILIRFLTFFVIEIVLSLFFFGIPLLVSIILLFALHGTALHDLTARTMVVDAYEQRIYYSQEELKRDLGLNSENEENKEEDVIEVEATPINKDVNENSENTENKEDEVNHDDK